MWYYQMYTNNVYQFNTSSVYQIYTNELPSNSQNTYQNDTNFAYTNNIPTHTKSNLVIPHVLVIPNLYQLRLPIEYQYCIPIVYQINYKKFTKKTTKMLPFLARTKYQFYTYANQIPTNALVAIW